MKKFKDLQVGDNVFIDFEKQVVTRIKLIEDSSFIVIYTDKNESYFVLGNLSVDYTFESDKLVFTEKEAMIEHCTKELKFLEHRRSCYEQWLERAKELE